MIDFHKEFAKALQTVLPTHYEMTLTAGRATPCISYMELNNSVEIGTDAAEYSRITYQVKVWSTELSELQTYALRVVDAVRPLGFKRTGSRELYDNNSTMIQKIMTFEAYSLEKL